LIDQYDLHELVAEDLTELNAQDKIDTYDDHLSVVLHFPKFDHNSQRYLLNEISIVLGKDRVITATRFPTNTISRTRQLIADEFDIAQHDEEEKYKLTPYYIMYLVIEALYDKAVKMLSSITRDLIHVEEQILNTNPDKQTIKSLMIKKRNISFLKYTFENQEELLAELTKVLPKFFEDELSVYFEDLATKHDKIMGMLRMAQENVDSMADTYDTLMTINTNDTVLILTIFTGMMLPMTLIT
jgi:magnesium transporter